MTSDELRVKAEPLRAGLLVQAVRAWSLPTSVVPAAAGGLVAIGDRRAVWWLLPVALLALLLLHAGVNVCNDVEDAARDADPPDKDRNSGLFNTGRLTIATGRRLYGACFVAAALLGFGICAVQGPALLVIGWIGILGGLLYTAGPVPYKYLGLGEVAIVMLMGPLITLGTFTAVTGRAFSAMGFWVGLGPGFLIAGVLAANNLTDIVVDTAAGARTVAVRIGFQRARALYLGLLAAALAAQVVLWVAGVFGAWILLPLLAAPALLRCAQLARSARRAGDPALLPLTPATGQAHLLFSLLLVAGVVLERA
ncbi:MAG TPA: 1,4-dihydroxy-2-naphthoate octaprenyltransferase [Solirubrobacteraceae bacterium]|nr:1,4-dihydroxy-2-naphthoate octaprenyltransferase [Solirubrobacteraceae bacterium]